MISYHICWQVLVNRLHKLQKMLYLQKKELGKRKRLQQSTLQW